MCKAMHGKQHVVNLSHLLQKMVARKGRGRETLLRDHHTSSGVICITVALNIAVNDVCWRSFLVLLPMVAWCADALHFS